MSDQMKDFMLEYLQDVEEARLVLANNFPNLSD